MYSLEEKKDQVILDSINEGVFTVDLNWKISSFNRAAERITGVSRSDAVGQSCAEVFRANICETSCSIRQTFSTGKPIENATAYIVNHDGIRIPIRLSTALVRNEKGEVIGGVETFQDLSQLELLQKKLKESYTFEDIIGRSPPMKKLFTLLPQIAHSKSTVLIQGPSGTGKELFAKALHNLSPRRDEPFVAVNCAALPDTLLESELFGYKAGAFTDAKKEKPGRFALAHRGSIFLDEIGDISAAMQVRLLRVLQDQQIEPLGSVSPVQVDVRVIAATNKDLKSLVESGEFRSDLYYRIRIIQLDLPPLRERREDIPLLVESLINKFNKLFSKNIIGPSDEVMTRLMDYDYPGNVRELENILEHAFILCKSGLIELHHLPPEIRPEVEVDNPKLLSMSLESMEKYMISEALRRHRGNRSKAAEVLGINSSTLYRKIKTLNIEPPTLDGRHRSH